MIFFDSKKISYCHTETVCKEIIPSIYDCFHFGNRHGWDGMLFAKNSSFAFRRVATCLSVVR
jgi:hypothetical protein